LFSARAELGETSPVDARHRPPRDRQCATGSPGRRILEGPIPPAVNGRARARSQFDMTVDVEKLYLNARDALELLPAA
jgi:hypothetical protein